MAITAISNLQVTAPPHDDISGNSSPETHKDRNFELPHTSSVRTEPGGNIDAASDHRELKKTVENLNKMIESMDTSLQFYVHKDSGRIAVKVINNKTQEIIREIPAEEILNLDAKLKETTGLIIDKKI